MVTSLLDTALFLMKDREFNCLAMGGIDFNRHEFDCWEITENDKVSKIPFLFFDLASLTKPLTLSAANLMYPKLFDEDLLLLLNHKANLPSWGRFALKNWRKQVLSFSIKPSQTLYSDFSALRLMLELEKKTSKNLRDLCCSYWHPDLLFWRDLKKEHICAWTGIRGGKKIQGQVHDDNAFIIGEFCSHAGLFSTIGGLCQSLINLDKSYGLLDVMRDVMRKECGEVGKDRFVMGWDRVIDEKETLAGVGASSLTFGHLGFTGTSIWIDTQKNTGHIILSNAVCASWFDRKGLNELRKKLGEAFWKSCT